jgi:polyisoprenoid-binding protein YceI
MAIRHFVQTVFGCAAGVALSMAAATAAGPAQDASPLPLSVASGRVSLAGTSNVHDYTASTKSIRVTRVQFAANVAGPQLWTKILEPGALEAFEIAIPAATLASEREGLDKNMHKALKTSEHSDITFRLRRLEPRPGGTGGALQGVGILKVAGVEREVILDLTTARKESGLSVSGRVAMLMTDFGITPPKAMLGMLKTDPKVVITFETLLTVPLT